MILDEIKLTSAVLDGEEEAPAEEAAPQALLDGEEEGGASKEGENDAPVALLDGEEEGSDAPSEPAEGDKEDGKGAGM